MDDKTKELLIQDLCSRIPYGVKIKAVQGGEACIAQLDGIDVKENKYTWHTEYYYTDWSGLPVPYLRPMKSMTEKEMEEMKNLFSPKGSTTYKSIGVLTSYSQWGYLIPYEYMFRVMSWLNAHHFDYNDLIEKGLAVEAEKDLYI